MRKLSSSEYETLRVGDLADKLVASMGWQWFAVEAERKLADLCDRITGGEAADWAGYQRILGGIDAIRDVLRIPGVALRDMQDLNDDLEGE